MRLPSKPPSAGIENHTEIGEQEDGAKCLTAEARVQDFQHLYTIHGNVARVPRGRTTEVLRWMSGWGVAYWFVRFLMAVTGLRRSAEVQLQDGTIRVISKTSILGRLIKESEQIITVDSLQRVLRQSRYPTLHLAIGVAALSFGVIVGGNWAFEGVISRNLVLLAGTSLALAGSALDLILYSVSYNNRAKVALEFDAKSGMRLRLVGVSRQGADNIVHELEKRLKKTYTQT